MLIHQLKIHFFSQYSSFLITQQKSKIKKRWITIMLLHRRHLHCKEHNRNAFLELQWRFWQEGHGVSQKVSPLSLSHFGCQRKLYFLSNCQKVLAFEALRDLACGKPPSQEIFSLGNITRNDEVPLFVTFVFDFRSNESFLHNRKRPDRIGKCSIPGE